MASDGQASHRNEVDLLLSKLKHLNITKSIYYDSTCPIAQGGFGDIFKGCYKREDGAELCVAIKRLRVYLDGGRDVTKIFRREIMAWSRLKHPNILPLVGYTLEETGDDSSRLPSLISEWMENGNILDFVTRRPDCNIEKLILGMAEGLAYLHANKTVHSDFKSGNVLISSNQDALISDFGAAHVSYDTQRNGASSTVTGPRGTARWLAYELLAHSEQYEAPTYESDTWSFGMTVYEVLTQEIPYAQFKHEGQIALAIIQKRLPSLSIQLQQGRWGQLCDICRDCWRLDPIQRPTMAAIAQRTKAGYLRNVEPTYQSDTSMPISIRGRPFSMPGHIPLDHKALTIFFRSRHDDHIHSVHQSGITHALDFPMDIEAETPHVLDVLIAVCMPHATCKMDGFSDCKSLLYPPNLSLTTTLELSSHPILATIRTTLFAHLTSNQYLVAVKDTMQLVPAGGHMCPQRYSTQEANKVATLVITLPSQFSGGALTVHNLERNEENYYSGDEKLGDVEWTAFLADCGYEVETVRKGIRLMISYNVLLRTHGSLASPDPTNTASE
ncbi:kinase-like protein [Fomitiporia mediterranea MF3/22]|uniref:kinase-like protein n=1 Tax=Fomitiporia mediterranea (strain MF3/22) TaxID=694068 RepID=UPI000440727B|nr:kinase-like protein [Fomitiporia mediterranea MF3/22]EJD05053.1 kinase-like protein [Fomitiporia mediterranea MF3/22]